MTETDQLTGKSYEDLVKLLDESLRKLESNQLTLEQSIAEYEIAVEIASAATKHLENATLRISEISTRLETKRDEDLDSNVTEMEW